MNKPHVHKDVIIAYANGAEIQYKVTGSDSWSDCQANPSFFADSEYRIKPEREYPKSSLTDSNLSAIHICAKNNPDSFRAIANAAIKQHIIDIEGK